MTTTITCYDGNIPISVDLYALDATTLHLRHHFMSRELRDTKTIIRRALFHEQRSTPAGQMLIDVAKKQRRLIKNHLDKIEVLM